MAQGKEFSVRIQEAVQDILFALQDEYGLHLDQHFSETPARVAKAYHEILGGLLDTEANVGRILRKVFDSTLDEMVILKGATVHSLCPHHLLPVELTVSLAYLPNGKVLGVSKLARIAELLSKRPVIQEDLTSDIAHRIQEALNCRGVAVKMEGIHYCMRMRGVKKDASIITQCMLGAFRDNASTRQEFLAAIQ